MEYFGKIEGEFGWWLAERLDEYGLSMRTMAADMHLSRRVIRHHLAKERKPSFQTIVTYCWYFDEGDDPDEIWEMVENDWVQQEERK